jgi:hypothetical protein
MSKQQEKFNKLNYLWMIPFAITVSPIGTCIFAALFKLDFIGCAKLIAIQAAIFFAMAIIGGEDDL